MYILEIDYVVIGIWYYTTLFPSKIEWIIDQYKFDRKVLSALYKLFNLGYLFIVMDHIPLYKNIFQPKRKHW